MLRFTLLILLASGASAGEGADRTGHAEIGKSAFGQCSGCHSIEPGHNMFGPSLAGIVGRPIASAPGYAYSPALIKGRGAAWTTGTLDTYLANPSQVFPGNRMGVAVSNPRTRADIIAYLANPKGK